MKGAYVRIWKLTALAALLTLAATPAFAAVPPTDTPNRDDNPGADHRPTDKPPANGENNKQATPGPQAGLPAKAKAYGRRCQGQSKKRSDAAEGTKGTPFSQCVTAMAKLATGATKSPRKACKALSRKRVAGAKGTPFRRCVVRGVELIRELELIRERELTRVPE
jgi:hypothetical protein